MGEVLEVLVLLVVGVPVVVGGLVWAARSLGAGPPRPPALPTSSRDFRNHQAMARWIERQLNDDMVRVTLSEDDQAAAAKLLADFYDERG